VGQQRKEGGRSAYRTERAVNDPTSVGMVPESPTSRLYRSLHHPPNPVSGDESVTGATVAPARTRVSGGGGASCVQLSTVGRDGKAGPVGCVVLQFHA
jgi:hypothetical protein